MKVGLFSISCALTCSLLLNADTSVDELIGLDLVELMDYPVISATKQLKPLSKVPATVRVITAEEIENYGYMTLEEALSDLPGMQFRNQNSSNTYSFMRGAPSQNNLILLMIDGVKINEINSGGFYGGMQHNLSNVKRIEVLYGPSSVLYGTNAMSGIINIITYSPEDYKNMDSAIGLGGGTFKTALGNFRTGFYDEKEKFGYTLAGQYVTSEKADLGGAKGDNNWGESMENFEDSYDIEGKINYKDFDMGFVFQNKQSSNTPNYKSVGTKYEDSGSLWDISFLNIWARHHVEFTPTLGLNSLVYYRDATVNDNTIFNPNTVDGQTRLYRPNSLWGIEEQLDYEFMAGQRATIGLVFEQERVSENFSETTSGSIAIAASTPPEPNMLTNELFSLYAQSEHEITENIEMTLGLRYDDSSYYGEVYTPRIALVYNADKMTVRLLASEAYRAARPWDYTYGIGNSGLESEKMRNYEVGLDYAYNDNLKSSLSLYQNTIFNKLEKDTAVTRWINSGKLITKGVEATVRYIDNELDAYLNYTYTLSEDEAGNETPEISKHTANAGADYKFSKHIKASLKANYIGPRLNNYTITATNSDEVEDAMIYNAQLSYYDFHKWDFHLQLKNAMDEEYYHTSNRSTVERYRQPQRVVMLYTKVKF